MLGMVDPHFDHAEREREKGMMPLAKPCEVMQQAIVADWMNDLSRIREV